MSRIRGECGCKCTLRLIENMNRTYPVNQKTQNMNYDLMAKTHIDQRVTTTHNERQKQDDECCTKSDLLITLTY